MGLSVAIAIDSTLVADTVAGGPAGDPSAGIAETYATPGPYPDPSLTIQSSLIENSAGVGVTVTTGVLHLLASVVRDSQPQAGIAGEGITMGDGSDLTIRGSLLERNRGGSVGATDTDVTIDSTLVRDTLPGLLGLAGSSGPPLAFARSAEITGSKRAPQAGITGSVFEGGGGIGVLLDGVAGTLGGVVVRNVAATDADRGYGVGLAVRSNATATGSLSARGLLVDGAVAMGINVDSVQADFIGVHVRNVTTDASGAFGDGITVDQSTASIRQSRIEGAPRAGISAFGSQVTVDSVALTCDAIALDSETAVVELASTYQFAGPATCSCNDSSQQCQVLSSSLSPPQPIQATTP
jgi:hypothetical protein